MGEQRLVAPVRQCHEACLVDTDQQYQKRQGSDSSTRCLPPPSGYLTKKKHLEQAGAGAAAAAVAHTAAAVAVAVAAAVVA